MNHNFISSQLAPEKCATCKRVEIDHTADATCEACGSIELCDVLNGILMCVACYRKELLIRAIPKSIEAISSELDKEGISSGLQTLRIKRDIFNSNIESIEQLRQSIHNDDTIVNKHYEFASRLKERYLHLKDIAFELSEKISLISSEQRAIQISLNQLANKLHAEEREQLKLRDITYTVASPKEIQERIKPIKQPTKRALDKVELKKYASELGVSEFILQTLVVSKGCSVEEAANLLRRTIAEGKSE